MRSRPHGGLKIRHFQVQPKIDHLDRRQPTEVEIEDEDHLDALARAGTPKSKPN